MLATEEIARLIPRGKDKAITRKALRLLTGYPDRFIRKCIATLRLNGLVIINTQDGRGYYKSKKISDMEAQYKITHSKAMKLLVQCGVLRRELKKKNVIVR